MRNPPQHFAPSPRRSPGAFPAAGNNGSQLRRPRSHLRRPPVAGRRRLQWEGDHHGWTRPAPPGARGQAPGSGLPSRSPEWPSVSPTRGPARLLGDGAGYLLGFLGGAQRQAWGKGRAGGEPQGAWEPDHEDIISGSHGIVHLSLERTRVLLSNWESVGPDVLSGETALRCFSIPNAHLQTSPVLSWKC